MTALFFLVNKTIFVNVSMQKVVFEVVILSQNVKNQHLSINRTIVPNRVLRTLLNYGDCCTLFIRK